MLFRIKPLSQELSSWRAHSRNAMASNVSGYTKFVKIRALKKLTFKKSFLVLSAMRARILNFVPLQKGGWGAS